MSKKIYGYIRVSTKEQNIDRQCIAMREFGVLQQNIYIDKQSGKDFDRPAYQRLMSILKPGDTLAIKSIDILNLWASNMIFLIRDDQVHFLFIYCFIYVPAIIYRHTDEIL